MLALWLLILPSWYEGFGLTVLEAQALQTPVICSDIPSLRETAGDGALFFSLKKPNDLVKKMASLLQSKNLEKGLIDLGHNNVKRFNWSDTAKKTLEAIQLVLTSPPSK